MEIQKAMPSAPSPSSPDKSTRPTQTSGPKDAPTSTRPDSGGKKN
jgi:hypothetical protein